LDLSPTARSARTDHLTSKLKPTSDDRNPHYTVLTTSNSCHTMQRELRATKAQ
jgi:hypothetical protein